MRASSLLDLRGSIGVAAIAGLILPTAANSAGDAEPHLPDPQWRASPHSRSPASERGAPNSPTAAVELPPGAPRAAMPHPVLPAQPASFEDRCAQPGVVLCDPLDDGHVQGVGITSRTANATFGAVQPFGLLPGFASRNAAAVRDLVVTPGAVAVDAATASAVIARLSIALSGPHRNRLGAFSL